MHSISGMLRRSCFLWIPVSYSVMMIFHNVINIVHYNCNSLWYNDSSLCDDDTSLCYHDTLLQIYYHKTAFNYLVFNSICCRAFYTGAVTTISNNFKTYDTRDRNNQVSLWSSYQVLLKNNNFSWMKRVWNLFQFTQNMDWNSISNLLL